MNKNIWIPKFNYYSKRLSMWQEKLWREVNGKPFMGILDNIAGRKTFEYATFGRSGIQQSNSKLLTMQMTAVCVWNASNAIPGDSGLTTQIDRGSAIYDSEVQGTEEIDFRAYGYSITGEHYMTSFGSIGTIDEDQYKDGNGTTRTIKGLYDTEAGGAGGGDVYFSIDTTSVPNTDVTWLDLTWDNTAGTPITSDRTTDSWSYTASLNGSSHWVDLTPSASYTDTDINTDLVITTS